tara:strand:+ start:242 stop:490 length:249 start_codon:yes stop_codon:yes gene_type:complete
MTLKVKAEILDSESSNKISSFSDNIFSKDYVDFLDEAGWKLEKKLPSNNNRYSDLLEDTEWKSNNVSKLSSRHFRRDLDALS